MPHFWLTVLKTICGPIVTNRYHAVRNATSMTICWHHQVLSTRGRKTCQCICWSQAPLYTEKVKLHGVRRRAGSLVLTPLSLGHSLLAGAEQEFQRAFGVTSFITVLLVNIKCINISGVAHFCQIPFLLIKCHIFWATDYIPLDILKYSMVYNWSVIHTIPVLSAVLPI